MSPMIDPRNIEVVDDQMAEVLRAKTVAERVEMICAANRTARRLAAAGVRRQHPDWEEPQVQAEVVRRVCGGTE
jgi:Arc/MetJ family transcription regulator